MSPYNNIPTSLQLNFFFFAENIFHPTLLQYVSFFLNGNFLLNRNVTITPNKIDNNSCHQITGPQISPLSPNYLLVLVCSKWDPTEVQALHFVLLRKSP